MDKSEPSRSTPARSQADWRQLADELETLDKKASEGRWYYGHGEGEGGLTRVDDGREADNALFPFYPEAHDAELICALRNEVPTILEALRTRSEKEQIKEERTNASVWRPAVFASYPDLTTPPSAVVQTFAPHALADELDRIAAQEERDLRYGTEATNRNTKPLREAAIALRSAIGTTYRQVGWAQIELRATQGGMLYEVAGSVSEERTEHHTEPVYIAVVEAADRHTLENVPSTNILKNDSSGQPK